MFARVEEHCSPHIGGAGFCLGVCFACIMFARVEEHCSLMLAVLVFVLFVMPVLCLRELRNVVPSCWRCWFLSCL